jgi:hypothetical protein
MTREKRNMRTNRKNFIISEDTLAKMTDDELHQLFLQVRGSINKSRRTTREPNKHTEIDMCYIQREMQNRKFGKKRQRH